MVGGREEECEKEWEEGGREGGRVGGVREEECGKGWELECERLLIGVKSCESVTQ